MAHQIVNVILTTFSGLGLPSLLSIPISASTPISTLRNHILCRLPEAQSRYIITTTANREVFDESHTPVTSLLSCSTDTLLPLRLSVPLLGGKGGFGSQLRAAGGRMSSRRKKSQGDSNSSNRNLDGRRLRTVNEAKALAEYLALKPEMEKKERETRRKRWEQVVELAEKREDEIRNGSKGRVDGKWVEDKEEAGERTREAVLAAMRSGDYHDNLRETWSASSESGSDQASEESEDDKAREQPQRIEEASQAKNTGAILSRSYFGFDEDDDFLSDGEELGGDEANAEVLERETDGEGNMDDVRNAERSMVQHHEISVG